MAGKAICALEALSDEQLMGRAGDGDEAAFDIIVRRHRGRLEAFVRRLMRPPDAAEDCVQEVFVRLWLARRTYQPRTKLTTFIYAIAVNCCIDHARRRKARPRTVPLEEQIGPGAREVLDQIVQRGSTPEAVVLRRYQLYRVKSAVHQLPLHHKSAFVLAHFEQLPYAEIADILGVPVGTVKSRVHHAIRRLREIIAPE